MAYIEEWLSAQLVIANPAVAFPMIAPQGQPLPIVIYRRMRTTRERHLTSGAGMPVASFALSVYANTYAAGKAIASDIRTQLDNFTGEASGVTINRCQIEDESDEVELPSDGNSKPVYIVSMSFEVCFTEV